MKEQGEAQTEGKERSTEEVGLENGGVCAQSVVDQRLRVRVMKCLRTCVDACATHSPQRAVYGMKTQGRDGKVIQK